LGKDITFSIFLSFSVREDFKLMISVSLALRDSEADDSVSCVALEAFDLIILINISNEVRGSGYLGKEEKNTLLFLQLQNLDVFFQIGIFLLELKKKKKRKCFSFNAHMIVPIGQNPTFETEESLSSRLFFSFAISSSFFTRLSEWLDLDSSISLDSK